MRNKSLWWHNESTGQCLGLWGVPRINIEFTLIPKNTSIHATNNRICAINILHCCVYTLCLLAVVDLFLDFTTCELFDWVHMECVRGLSATIYLFNWAKYALVLNTGGELEWVIFSKNGTLLYLASTDWSNILIKFNHGYREKISRSSLNIRRKELCRNNFCTDVTLI